MHLKWPCTSLAYKQCPNALDKNACARLVARSFFKPLLRPRIEATGHVSSYNSLEGHAHAMLSSIHQPKDRRAAHCAHVPEGSGGNSSHPNQIPVKVLHLVSPDARQVPFIPRKGGGDTFLLTALLSS